MNITSPKYLKADTNRFKQFCSSKMTRYIKEEINSDKRHANTQEARHLVFLKVHKAASSTVQNIFLRFGAIRDLVFILPKTNTNVISITESVTKHNVLPPPTGRTYDILCCHVIYNKLAMQTVMPKDTFYIGILRHPYAQFLSSIKYFHPPEFFNIPGMKKITTFLHNPTRYISRSTVGHFLNNRMAYDFNFPRELFINRKAEDIQRYLRFLDKEFSIVLIADHLDESLVLMRRLLGWKLKDILHGRINEGKLLFTEISKMKKTIKELHRSWAELDYHLYDYFYKRLFEKIKLEGPDFQKELGYFKRIQLDVKTFCQSTVKESMVLSMSPWNEQFEITNLDCIYMNIRERVFIQEIRHQQYVKN
ncbi:galactose-3-O-sulfotransferase 2-like [Argopecten irradians]|uniref:galactose-3-O-sulfotransferase 2-like n=1 Tax=Argopecten irradians TaxID=31199 RepID=UPI0037133DCF